MKTQMNVANDNIRCSLLIHTHSLKMIILESSYYDYILCLGLFWGTLFYVPTKDKEDLQLQIPNKGICMAQVMCGMEPVPRRSGE